MLNYDITGRQKLARGLEAGNDPHLGAGEEDQDPGITNREGSCSPIGLSFFLRAGVVVLRPAGQIQRATLICPARLTESQLSLLYGSLLNKVGICPWLSVFMIIWSFVKKVW